MLRWALLFLTCSLASALFGFTDVAGHAWLAARVLFFVFTVLFVVSLVVHNPDRED